MKIITEQQNDLFNRIELKAVVEAKVNPSFPEVKKLLSEKKGVSEDQIDVEGINGNFGSHTFQISACIYGTKEDLEKAKQTTKKQRVAAKKTSDEDYKTQKEAEQKPADDAPAEEAPVEKKIEEEVKDAPVEEKAQDAPA
ncbi:hypothetical protein GOV14_06265 [Candidatus Pacearchaeota archaeon]|nr:hypothetical protein [Candidatus Pacearchaeota archaeon]